MSAPTYADFLADPNRRENLLVEVVGYDTVLLDEHTYRFSHDEFATEAGDTPASTLYDRRVIGPFQRVTSAVGGDGGARHLAGFFPSQTGAVVKLKQYFGDLDLGTATCMRGTPIRQVAFGGRAITVKHGGICAKGALPFSAYRVLASGVVDGQALVGLNDVALKIKGNEERLKSAVQIRRLTGTGRCLIFNGTTTEVDCGTDAAFNITSGALSITVGIYVEDYPASETIFLTHGATNTDGYSLAIGTAGAIRFRTNQSGASQSTLSTAIPKSQWVWLQVSRTGAVASIYFDGVYAVDTAGVHVNPTGNAARHLYFGRNDAGTSHFAGALDEIWIRGAASAEDEFEEWQHRPLDPSEYATFLGYWPCEDGFGSGITTLDNLGSLGSAADGTVTAGFFAASCMGAADLSGRPMPDTWGQYRGHAPVCVDVGTATYLVHSSRSEEITKVRVGGSDAYVDGTTYDGTAGNSWLAFVQATTADGAIDRCMSHGWTLFRIGGAPRLKLSVEGKGDKSDGTYRNTVGALCRYIATTRGEQPFDDTTEIDDTVFDAFDAAHTAIVGLAYTAERTVESAILDLAQTYSAALSLRRSSGKLTIKQFDDPQTETPVATIVNGERAAGSLSPMERGAPFGKVTIRYDENNVIMGSGELYEELGTDDPEAAAFARLQWRRTVRRSPGVFRVYLDALPFDVATRFVNVADANAEKARFAALSREPDQGFTFHCEAQPVELDFGDVVILHIVDLNEYSEEQDRLGTHADARFYVIGISDHEQGGYVLDLWRPRVA